ncbi:MAG: hypothetical protein NTW07_12805 [candidate division Zixibacteria bacterium]|nr:hypothetical protein [candidate division Zixibacteria bacterium]
MLCRSVVVVLLLSGLMLLAGCDRHITSRDPVRSLPDAPPVPQSLAAQLGDREVTLSWEVTDSAAVELFRIYISDGADAPFALFDTTRGFSKGLSGLPLNRPVQLRVTSLTSSRVEGRPSEAISVTAGLLRILIENGEDYTFTRDVTVQISTPVAAAYVELSEASDFVGATLREFYPSVPFELSQGDGVKTVYARLTLEHGDGLSGVLSDDIILDTEARIDSVWFMPRNATFEVGDTVFFYLRARGEIGGGAQVSFPGVARILLRDTGTGGDLTAADGIYSTSWIVPVGVSVSDGEVTGAFTDAAGNNASAARASQLLNIRTATIPAPVVLAVGLADSTTAHLSWTMNEDNAFASYRVYRSGTDVEIQGDNDQLVVAVITNQATTEFNEFLAGSGIYWYKVFVFDAEGLYAGSNQVAITR